MNSSERFRAGEVYVSPNARRVGWYGGRRDSRMTRLPASARIDGFAVASLKLKTFSPPLLPANRVGLRGRAPLTRPRTPRAQHQNISAFRAAAPFRDVWRAPQHTF